MFYNKARIKTVIPYIACESMCIYVSVQTYLYLILMAKKLSVLTSISIKN